MTREDIERLRADIDKAQRTLSALCKNPRSFTMRIPVDKERDTDVLLGNGLRAGKKALSLAAAALDARDALEFYADGDSYVLADRGDGILVEPDIVADNGDRARAALAKLEAARD